MELAKCHIAYAEYGATGEGATVMVALGGSATHAENLFRSTFDQFFHIGMVVAPLNEIPEDDAPRILRFVPAVAVDLIEENLPGQADYYCQLDCNMS